MNLELGRVVRSPKYGKGFIAEIEGDTIKVRFWRYGCVTFHKPEGDYPFQLLDEIRPVSKKSLVEKVLARETRAEKRERARRCPHRKNLHLCVKCAGLGENDIKKWDYTTERFVTRRFDSKDYNGVKISSNDEVLVSRPGNTVQGNGASEENYAGAAIPARVRRTEKEEIEEEILRDLFTDPNSRFQSGGTGYLRIPLDAPRSTRADAPEWLDCRESFLATLKNSRSERAERILRGFYVEGTTDQQIAESERWTKDAIKKERKTLVRTGDAFFQRLAA